MRTLHSYSPLLLLSYFCFLNLYEHALNQIRTERQENREPFNLKNPSPYAASEKDWHTWDLASLQQFPFPYSSPYTEHGFYGALTEPYELYILLILYCNCILTLLWTYTNSPELKKHGEGGLLSDTRWTVVKQHDARWLDFVVIPPNIPPNKKLKSMQQYGSTWINQSRLTSSH